MMIYEIFWNMYKVFKEVQNENFKVEPSSNVIGFLVKEGEIPGRGTH